MLRFEGRGVDGELRVRGRFYESRGYLVAAVDGLLGGCHVAGLRVGRDQQAKHSQTLAGSGG